MCLSTPSAHALSNPPPQEILTVVNIQHQGVRALNQNVHPARLRRLHVVDSINDKLGQLLAVLAEAGNLLLDVVLQKVAKALLVAGGQLAQLGLEVLLVEDLVDPDSVAGRLVRVGRADAAPGRANLLAGQLLLLQAVDAGVQFEVDLGAVADQEVLACVREPLRLEGGEFLEEGLDVEDNAGANQVGTLGVDEARGQEMEAARCEVNGSSRDQVLQVVVSHS
jgi:hypothetical protein